MDDIAIPNAPGTAESASPVSGTTVEIGTAPYAIEAEALVKTFGEEQAVRGLDFRIGRGARVALLGGNGAGKTTTIGMLLGLLIPSSGSVRILSADMTHKRFDVARRINFSSPYVDLPGRLTVRQNLMIYGHLYGLRHLAARVEALVADLNLTKLIDRQAVTLSAGQKTRLSLAKALINEPEVLLLDEPTASLDPDTGDFVRGYLEKYMDRTGATLLLASHNMAEVERLCGHVLMMREGRIHDHDSPAGLIARYGRQNLEEVFLDIARQHKDQQIDPEGSGP